jgi:hypothetical protein
MDKRNKRLGGCPFVGFLINAAIIERISSVSEWNDTTVFQIPKTCAFAPLQAEQIQRQ